MSFISFSFLVFFPLVLLGYYTVPKKFQWIWLLIGSYVFYAFSSLIFIVFLIASTITTYFSALLIGKLNEEQAYFDKNPDVTRETKKQKWRLIDKKKSLYLAASLAISLGILLLLKYSNFAIRIINTLGASISAIDWLILPLGISFYTFQSIGYNIDVYRGIAKPQKNFLKYALFVSYFPQIAQGPIGRYNQVSPQFFVEHSFDWGQIREAFLRICIGFFKRLVIAGRLGVIVDLVYQDYASYSGAVLLFATILFAVQIYMDFSGYMDIALGCSKAMGIKLSENFNSPYLSKSIAEFWRRWHITLGAWFKDYVFYSLLRTKGFMALSKKLSKAGYKSAAKNVPTVLALVVVWSLVGLWHGADIKFLVYGLFHGSFIILSIVFEHQYERCRDALQLNPPNKIYQTFQIVRTFTIVTFGYILFRSESFSIAIAIMGQVVSKTVFSLSSLFAFATLLPPAAMESIFSGFLALGAYLLFAMLDFRFGLKEKIVNGNSILKWCAFYVLLLSTLLLGYYGSEASNSFIYFDF